MAPEPFREHYRRLQPLGAILPLSAGSKKPLRGTGGVRDATRHLPTLTKWADQVPTANIGLATGDGLLVIDIDPRNGGIEQLAGLQATLGPPPNTAVVATPGADGHPGHHYYVLPPEPTPTVHLGGVDVQGIGAYVVAPGSLVNQRQYHWEVPLDRWGIAPLPAAWMRYVVERRGRQSSGATGVDQHVEEDDRLPGQRRELPVRTWEFIRNGQYDPTGSRRDEVLGAVVMSMVRCRWTYGEACAVVLDPRNAVSEKLLERGPTWAQRELCRTWLRCKGEVLNFEPVLAQATAIVSRLELMGDPREQRTDRRVLGWLVEKAAQDPNRTNLTIADGIVVAVGVRTSQRLLREDLGIGVATAHRSLARLMEAGLIDRTVTGAWVQRGPNAPSEFSLRIGPVDLGLLRAAP